VLVNSPPLHDIMIELAQHTGLLALLVLAFSQIIHATHLYRSRWRSVLMGAVFGIFSVACMMIPVTVGRGLILDGRNVMMALSGLLGGPVSAAVSVVPAVAYRIAIGGPAAAAGCGSILFSAALGALVWWQASRSGRRSRFRDLVLLGALAGGLGQLPIILLPTREIAWHFVTVAALPLAVSTAGGIILLGALLLIELRRLVEADKLRLLAGHATDIIARSTLSGKQLYVSPACREILGFDADELVGTSFTAIIHPDDLRSVQDVIRSLTPEHPRQMFTCRFRRADGSYVWLEVTLRLVPATSSDTLYNGPAEIVSVARDISKRKAVEAQLAAAKAQAEAASRAKSGFLANMSHELRTPLNAIIGFAELIRTETMGPVGNRTYCDYAKDIHDSGHHLLSLINDVLDLSKIEADRMVLDEETVDLSSVVATCIRMSRTQATRGGVSLVADIDPKASLVRGEQRRLMQVVLNLISNAVKYTRQGGSVTVATRMACDGSLELIVRDTGCGIAERDLAVVMQPFGQIDNPYNRINQGTGLGLPLARRLVELHDGALLLESKVGVGTTATVMLPADRVIDTMALGSIA
jgi:PAS domain S-box-containing protein